MEKKNAPVPAMVVLLGANILAWSVVFELAKPPYLEVTFFDIGQGDAALIETPQRHQILIDGGPTSAVTEKLGKAMPFWDRTIDLVILTHPERDHLAGLLDVLKRYRVQNILWTGVVRKTPEYQEWLSLLEKEGAQIWFARAGQRVLCSANKLERCEFEVLSPLEAVAGREFQNSNNTSLVTRLTFNKKTFLFTGDIERGGENALLSSQGAQLDSDVLKVAHHGSKTSSGKEFVNAVSPEIAVISAGRNNRYGHPHAETLETLETSGAKILRTDGGKDITLISDGIVIKEK